MNARVAEVNALLAALLAERAGGDPLAVVVHGSEATAFAAALAAALPLDARVTVGTEPPGDVLIHLRSGRGSGDPEHSADVVIDHHDPRWPVIRRVRADLADPERWYLSESRAFFGVRAATWDAKFGDDLPSYAAAVAKAGVRPGDIALDVGCGTGRALPALAAAVGAGFLEGLGSGERGGLGSGERGGLGSGERGGLGSGERGGLGGRVIGLDLTPDMLAAARRAGRDRVAALVIADARRLPLSDGSVDVVFAAGLIQHLPDPTLGLAELARVTRPGGRLAIFHPSGRAALAARHGRTLRPDEPLAEPSLGPMLAAAGWLLTAYEDAPDHFFAAAVLR